MRARRAPGQCRCMTTLHAYACRAPPRARAWPPSPQGEPDVFCVRERDEGGDPLRPGPPVGPCCRCDCWRGQCDRSGIAADPRRVADRARAVRHRMGLDDPSSAHWRARRLARQRLGVSQRVRTPTHRLREPPSSLSRCARACAGGRCALLGVRVREVREGSACGHDCMGGASVGAAAVGTFGSASTATSTWWASSAPLSLTRISPMAH